MTIIFDDLAEAVDLEFALNVREGLAFAFELIEPWRLGREQK